MNKSSAILWQEEQHQNLFRIIDLLKETDGSHVLEQLISYINDHFSLEEKYMKQVDYPEFDKHVLAHRKFEEKIKEYTSDRPIFDEEFAVELSGFLSEWLKGHVFGLDKELEKFLLSSEVK